MAIGYNTIAASPTMHLTGFMARVQVSNEVETIWEKNTEKQIKSD